MEDQSDLRRGRPTLWKLWGVPQAINAGDALYTIAHSAVHRLHDRSVPAERVIAAHRHFSQTCLHLTQGQFLDLSYETRDDVGAEDYLLMIGGKTAALVSGAAALGAIVAGSDRVDDYAAFGRGLGLAFQIQDDLLGIWGDPGVTGKSAATDILSRKKSLPVLFGLENSEALRELYAAPRLDVPRIVALLEEVGAKAFAEQMAGDYTQRAAVALDAAQPQGNAGDLLRALTISLLGRQA